MTTFYSTKMLAEKIVTLSVSFVSLWASLDIRKDRLEQLHVLLRYWVPEEHDSVVLSSRHPSLLVPSMMSVHEAGQQDESSASYLVLP